MLWFDHAHNQVPVFLETDPTSCPVAMTPGMPPLEKTTVPRSPSQSQRS